MQEVINLNRVQKQRQMQSIPQKQNLDYFKLFKILELKKLPKQGEVKLVHDKTLGRKILAVEGNVSTQNYITLQTNTVTTYNPAITFSQKYLYLIGYAEPAKNFCFQIVLQCNSKNKKFLFSSLYKTEKQVSNGVIQMPLTLKHSIWTFIIVDLHDLCERIKGPTQKRVSSQVMSLEIRANSKIKNIYQSDYLYDPSTFPKEMELPLKGSDNFYEKYNYFVITNSCQPGKQNSSQNSNQQKKEQCEISFQQTNKPNRPKKNANPSREKQQKNISTSVIGGKHPKSKKDKAQQSSKNEEEFINSLMNQQEDDEMPRVHLPPKPQITINGKLVGLEGNTIFVDGIIALQAFVLSPTVFAVHKPIRCLKINKNNPFQLALGYNDGSISIWDIIRQKSLCYLKTDISKIKAIEFMQNSEGNVLYLVGTDSKKREIIMIIHDNQITYQKVSTFPISNIFVPDTRQQIFITYGHQNIRIWKPNPENSILNGTSIYLGKMNIKVYYKSCCQISEELLYLVDSNGYLTQIDIKQQKTIEICKISEHELDHILHIAQIRKLVIIDIYGVCHLMDYELNIEEEFQFRNRVRNVCYQVVNQEQIVLKLQNYNKSLAEFTFSTGNYNYLMRSHNQPIIKLQYMSKVGKIVTISQDNTIRIWGLMQKNEEKTDKLHYQEGHKMQWMIKEQYEFLVQTGERGIMMVADQQQYVYIGKEDGKVLKIDAISYRVIGQANLPFLNSQELQQRENGSLNLSITDIQISKNGKNLLFSINIQNHSNLASVALLTDNNLNIIQRYECPLHSNNPQSSSSVYCKFNQSFKKFLIIWRVGEINRIQTYSLNEPNTSKYEFYIDEKPSRIQYGKQSIVIEHLNNRNDHYLAFYRQDAGELQKIINIGDISKNRASQFHNLHTIDNKQKVQYPYHIFSNKKDQLEISTLLTNKNKANETIDLPESVCNITLIKNIQIQNQQIHTSDSKTTSLILCTGEQSYGLYCVLFSITNLPEVLAEEDLKQTTKKMLASEENNQFLMGISTISRDTMGSHNAMQRSNPIMDRIDRIEQTHQEQQSSEIFERTDRNDQDEQIMEISQQPKQLTGLYQKEQQMFDQVKHVIFGDQQQPQNEECLSDYNPKRYQDEQQESEGLALIYGWNTKYSPSNSILLWFPQNQSLLLYDTFSKALILHYFKEPISQKIIHLPIQPNFITELGARNNGRYLNKEAKYIAVGIGNQLKLYDTGLNYSKTLTSFGETIIDASISICFNFIVVLSSQNNKLYIQILDLITTNTVSSTYLQQPNYTHIQIIVNPFQTCLQFMLFTNNQVFFYRLTSILTLQVQTLNKVCEIVNEYSGELTCAEFLKLPDDGEQLILFGTEKGTVIVVDGRAAQILVVCKQVVNRPIMNILYNYSQENQGALTITTKSNTISFFKISGENSLNSLMRLFQKEPTYQLTIDSQVSSHSFVHELQSHNGTLGMLTLSKLGILWLLDLQQNDTIKILSSHTASSKNNVQIAQVVPLEQFDGFISGANDGCIKLTSIHNLEQTNEIYKPKRRVKDILFITKQLNSLCNLLITAFNSQIYFYNFQSPQNWKFLGSIQFPTQIIKIKHIPYSNNFIVCGSKSIFLVYVAIREKFIAELHQICDTLSHPIDLQVYGYNLIQVRQLNKIDVWIRKIKRSQNILKELSENIHEVKYYMMDSYQCTAASSEFLFRSNKLGSECKQYVCCLRDRSLIEYRDFDEHTIIREVQMGVSNPTSMICLGEFYCIGDEHGYVHILNQNGLQMQKIRVFGNKIKGIVKYSNSDIKKKLNRLIVYGQSIAIINI